MLARRSPWTNFAAWRSFSSSSSSPRKLKVGDILRERRVYSSEDVTEYSKVSHDANPLHFDPQSARNAGFENRLVHGMLVAALFPRIISSRFPGVVYVSQSLNFRVPVYIDDLIVGEVEATALRATKQKYLAKFATKCFKNEVLVLDGEATVILPSLCLPETHSLGSN